MKKRLNLSPRLLATLIVPVGIFLAMLFSSFITGAPLLLSMFMFWFIIVPVLASYLPVIFIKNGDTLIPSLTGLTLFYLFMVWMIYKNYESDVFQIIMTSAVFNLFVITLIGVMKYFFKKQGTQF